MLTKGKVFAWFFSLFVSISQAANAAAPITIPFIDQAAVIDGKIDEQVWQRAKVIDINIVNSPYDNTPSPIKTTAFIYEDGEQLYVAFEAHDPDPSKIQAFLRDRDKALIDDLVGIKLDTYNDHRLAYKFYTNALGVQNDGIENVMAGSNDDLWDGIWSSYGRITEFGFVVEIAIPFRILNFDNSTEVKTWAIELFRMYPRNERLRISNIPLDRNNDCWVCQMAEIKGFQQAHASDNLTVTPSFVTNRQEIRDLNDNWQADSTTEIGLNVRWGINANTLLNATINPDFSTVETDAGQLSINKNFSLFYDEKRAFFLDNTDYFTSHLNLVYTRNIADPDFGSKLTGRVDNHTYGLFVTNDALTTILVPGNVQNDVGFINDTSYNAAFRYRYDVDENLSFGWVNTLRATSDYHNLLSAFDSKYKLTDSDTFIAQILHSNTEYPDDFASQFCYADSAENCAPSAQLECQLGNCDINEVYLRTNQDQQFSGNAVALSYEHSSEHWTVAASFQEYGRNFRADLGYVPKVDIQDISAEVSYVWYGEGNTWWQEIYTAASSQSLHNTDGELIEKSVSISAGIDGPYLSYFDVNFTHADKIGLRHDASLIAIDNNTSRFSEDQLTLYFEAQPHKQLKFALIATTGDQIDYTNDRLGELSQFTSKVFWNINQNMELTLSHTKQDLDADKQAVFAADLVDLNLSYQFNVNSYLKLNLTYTDISRNLENYPLIAAEEFYDRNEENLATQLIYSYKINPQSVFFLGYSDNSFANDITQSLHRDERTVFLKFSYAWMK